MQDKSLIEPFEWQEVIERLGSDPITEKCLKVKLQRIFHLNSTCEHEYLPDVRELHQWLVVFARHADFRTFIAGDKLQRYFIEQFLPLSIKYLILSKKFKLAELMALTEQIILESLDLLVKMFGELDRYPKFVNAAVLSLEHVRYFYKLNFQATYLHLLREPTEEERNASLNFIDELKEGSLVDALKLDTFTGVMMWSRAVVTRVNTNVLAVSYLNDRRTSDRSMSKANMQIFPLKHFTADNYDWRLEIKAGDKVDYSPVANVWKLTTVAQVRNIEEDGQTVHMLGLNTLNEGSLEWVSSTSVNVQPARLFSTEEGDSEDLLTSKRNVEESKVKDYNDVLLTRGKFGGVAVCRSELSKSLDIVYFIDHLHQTGFFELLIKRLDATPPAPIEVTIELIGVVAHICRLFHREFALSYLPRLCDSLVKYLLTSPDSNIRNFNKERLDTLFLSFQEFFSRYLSLPQKRAKKYELQPRLARMFIDSQFLDRKLNSMAIMSDLIRQARLEEDSLPMLETIHKWIVDNRIIEKLYQEGTHPELISRSSDLLKVHLSFKPPLKSLEPLLQLNEPLLKLIVDNLSYFPIEFLREVGDRIVAKELPLDNTTLSIVKAVGGYEKWLLSKGGMGWTDIVKEKKSRQTDILELLNHPFPLVSKIFLEIIKIEYKFIQVFLKHACEIDYAQRVLDDPNIDTFKKVEFLRPYFKYLTRVDEHGVQQIDQLWEQITTAANPTKQMFDTFMQLLEQVEPNQTENFFMKHFTKVEDLRRVTTWSFNVFTKLVANLNDRIDDAQVKLGLSELITLIFQNENLAVTKRALELMSHLMDKFEREETGALKEGFLQKCLARLYEGGSQQKYLSILSSILNESEKAGNGNLSPVSRQLPPEKMHLTVINHFNELRKRLHLTVDSNLTLYQLRHEIGKMVNAFGHELKLYCGEKLLDDHWNAQSIDSLPLEGSISISKKHKIERVELTAGGKLTDDATRIFRIIFDEYSTNGLMSKNDCKRLQKRMVGDSMIFVESKVNKIFQNYDADKDDHLKFSEFITQYEMLAKVKPNSVWSGLEALGVREDLKVLGEVPLTQPDPTTLPRYFLIHNDKFMGLLFQLLAAEGSVSECAWAMLMRLPIYTARKDFNKSNKYELRYWLYLIDAGQSSDKLTNNDLEKVLANDDETLAIGLKVAERQSLEVSSGNFSTLLQRIEIINADDKLNKFSKIVLKFSLMLVARAVESQTQLKQEFLKDNARFERLFLSGLMSSKVELRNIYIEAVAAMFRHFNRQPDLFSMFFNIVYSNFEKCNKKDLSLEYFDLFSGALEEARSNNLLQQLGGNNILETVVKVFREHETTEKSLSSPEDHVAIGFMRLIGTLLTGDYLPDGFVGFLFNDCLYPQQGNKRHELKSTRSRKEAYELIYRLCKNDPRQLDQLFLANFKKIYKSISHVKLSYYYKEYRSEYGYAGIHNLGCICYMISMLQQFFLTRPFRYLLLMADDGVEEQIVKHAGREIDDNLFHQLQCMFANLQLTERQEYNPEDFCFAFKDFDGNPVNVGVQQDAQEFLNMLFDKVEQSLKPTPFRHLADNIYGGRYCNQFVCSSCKHVIERHENFFSLSLEIKGQKTIQDSFKKFITGEVISDYRCDNCDKKCDTAKRCFISGLPNYLILYLQRICFNYDKFENEKINTRWEFPHELNVFDYTIDKEKGGQTSSDYDYVLKGIVVHIGSAEFGHYFSYIKTPEGSWLEYNDERVREFDPKDIEDEAFGGGVGWRKDNQSAYLLLYEKVHKKPFKLEFVSEEEKQEILARFGLKEIVQQTPASILNEAPSEEKFEKKEEEAEPQATQAVSTEPKPIIANIDLLQVQPYVSEKARSRIDKANEDFTLQIQVSSSEFMEFLYKISTIDPPAHLKNEFLELCYECFPLKQTIGDTHVSICDEMPKRFNELIRGSGWYFFETQSANWNKELFNMEKTIRVGTKRLIVSVLTDIFETYPPTVKEHADEDTHGAVDVEQEQVTQQNNAEETTQETSTTLPLKQQQVVVQLQQATTPTLPPKQTSAVAAGVQQTAEETEEVNTSEAHEDSNVPEAPDDIEISDVPDAFDDQNDEEQALLPKPIRKCDTNDAKLEAVYEYLGGLVGLMKEQVQDGWLRMQEYFELWIELIRVSPQIREFLSEQKMTELLLDYLLEDSSPLKLIPNRRKFGVRHYSFNFEQAFELLFELISEEKSFSENELKCFASYAFLEKLVKAVAKKPGFISSICRDNAVVSERVAYCISESLMKVTHSDESKPLIESIIEYLGVKDELAEQRKEWIIGLPQLEYHSKTMSYGMYALPTVLDPVYGYYSPLGILPVLHIIHYMREKYEHVTVLLATMLLQLERDGMLDLNRYPANLPLQRDYTAWFDSQVDRYYEQMVDPKGGQKIPDNYKGYATRIHTLWHGRPDLPQPQRYLIGKSISEKEVRCIDLPKLHLKVTELELTSVVAPVAFEDDGELKHFKKFLHRSSSSYFTTDPDLIDSCPNADMFLRRGATSNVMDEPQRHEGESPFDRAFKCDYIRKIVLRNNGPELLVLLRFVPCEGVNSWLPHSPVRFAMRANSDATFVMTKEIAEQPWGEYELEVEGIEQTGTMRLKDYPQQLITPYAGEEEVPSDADDDDSFTGYYAS